MLILAEASPEVELGTKIGYVTGSLFVLLLLGFAARTFFQVDRNKKCALSMILVTAGWSVMSVTYALSKFMDAAWMLVPALCVAVLLALAGSVTAILGLVGLSDRVPRQAGGAQAVATLAISGLFFLLVTVGFVRGLRGVPDDWMMTQPQPGSRISVVSKNFSIGFPGPDWIQVVPQKLNPRAELAFVQPKKHMYVIILAHPVPGASGVALQSFAEVARKEMMQLDPAAVIDETKALNVGSCQGMAFNADARAKGQLLTYREWVSVHGSVAYQVLSWGMKRDVDFVRRETDALVGTFESLTP